MQGRSSHDAKDSLGRFELQVISVAAAIMSDNAITARVSLMDTIIDDLRMAKQAGITRYGDGATWASDLANGQSSGASCVNRRNQTMI